jgi:hypothetical protein
MKARARYRLVATYPDGTVHTTDHLTSKAAHRRRQWALHHTGAAHAEWDVIACAGCGHASTWHHEDGRCADGRPGDGGCDCREYRPTPAAH